MFELFDASANLRLSPPDFLLLYTSTLHQKGGIPLYYSD